MTFWEFLHRLGPGWPGTRGWYAFALFLQTAAILAMVALFPELRTDEFFKSLATAIVITGWIGFAVGMRDPAKDREQMGDAVAATRALAERLPTNGGLR
ncbi:hypothetical protein [uncultured Sphingomonas sp.]|uniref:hypothetical protein n=1 Tax=uncultured Sphingomonas sp. TaxID=158754 RepID=UPI002585A8F0|nr:hypothetical protein [uncultured Sphingomonas sp.]